MNQIRDIGVPEKMRRHMKIQSIVDALVRSASLTVNVNEYLSQVGTNI